VDKEWRETDVLVTGVFDASDTGHGLHRVTKDGANATQGHVTLEQPHGDMDVNDLSALL
jgi:hypothetical protein